MDERDEVWGDNEISPRHTQATVGHHAGQCYFRPDTEELVFIAGSEAGAFETHWRSMMVTMDAFHQANAEYSSRLRIYAEEAIKPALPPAKLEAHAAAVDAGEAALEASRKAMQNKLRDLSNKGASYDEVVELIPVAQGKKARGSGKAPRYAYVKKGYFSQTKDGRKLHSVSLKSGEKDGAKGSIYVKDKNGNARIDAGKLHKQLTTLNTPKIKLDLKKALKLIGSDFDPETLSQDVTLWDWAESWNNSLKYKKAVGDNTDVTAGAQFMRFVSNVGMNVDFDPSKKRAVFKGEAKASLTLASGFVTTEIYAPDRRGWALTVQTDNGKAFDMGMFRLCIEAQLSGFVGATAQLEAQLQVVGEGDQQRITGQPEGRLPRFRERKVKGRTFHQALEAKEEGVQVSGEAFAGARVEGSLKGSVQWLKPTAPDGDAAALQSGGTFTNFCTFGPSIAGLAGAGIGGKLHCTFLNGRFCFHISASLCWGAGAKGGFLAEVDAATIGEFGSWLIYQLYSLDYAFFDVIEEKAFTAYTRYCVMKVSNAKRDVYDFYNEKCMSINDVLAEFSEFLEGVISQDGADMMASVGRNQMAINIYEFKEDLLLCTPEAKGILLYLLTRHGKMDHFDLKNRTLLGDIYADRKEAIICILTSVQTVNEWNEVLCHMTEDGSRVADNGDRLGLITRQEEHLIRFLQEGHNRDDELHRAKWNIQVIRNRLKSGVTRGYALSMNDSVYYALHRESNPHYVNRCHFGPCDDQHV